jgi:hypothetical protein
MRRTHKIAFPTGRDFVVPRDNEKSLCCPKTKGQWDRSPFIVPGQRDKLKILTWNGPGRDFDILPRDGPGWDFDSLSRPRISWDSHGTEEKQSKKNYNF